MATAFITPTIVTTTTTRRSNYINNNNNNNRIKRTGETTGTHGSSFPLRLRQPPRLQQQLSDDDDQNDKNSSDNINNNDGDTSRLWETRNQLAQRLEDVNSLQESLQAIGTTKTTTTQILSDPSTTASATTTTTSTTTTTLDLLEQSLDEIETDVNQLVNQLLPPPGCVSLSQQDYVKAVTFFVSLPRSVRWALCTSLEQQQQEQQQHQNGNNKKNNRNDKNNNPLVMAGVSTAAKMASQWDLAPDIVARLYQYQDALLSEPTQLQQALDQTLNFQQEQQQVSQRSSSNSQDAANGPRFVINIDIGSNKNDNDKNNNKDKKKTTKPETTFLGSMGLQNLLEDDNNDKNNNKNDAADDDSMSFSKRDQRAFSTLPRVTREKGREVTTQQLQTILSCLEDDTKDDNNNNKDILFRVKGTESFPGGYVIFGNPVLQRRLQSPNRTRITTSSSSSSSSNNNNNNRNNEASILVETIDDKLSSQTASTTTTTTTANFGATVCYVQDEDYYLNDNADDEPVLLVISKDLSPTTNPLVFVAATAMALGTVILFVQDVYNYPGAAAGADGAQVLSHLAARNAIEAATASPTAADLVNGGGGSINNNGNPLEFMLFQQPNMNAMTKYLNVLFPLAAIQGCHELGHVLVAAKEEMNITFPTLVPCWGSPPFLCCLTKFRESPKTFTALFDFALAGPFLGLLVSLTFLVSGLQLTNAASPNELPYFPALSVNVLSMSTLAGTLVDYFAGGQEGFVSSQDPNTFIPLHPLAIAGYVGLLINALELLPIGATDGGRLSLSVFGRREHAVLSGLFWLVAIVLSLFLDRADFLVGAWLAFSFTQRDYEIPCRDEVTKLDSIRATIAFALWFFVALVVIPM